MKKTVKMIMTEIAKELVMMANKVNQAIRDFGEDEAGIAVVELILIVVVLVGLTVIFRDQLTSIIGNIFQRIASESSAI